MELRDLVAFNTVSDPANGIRPGRECPLHILSRFRELGLEAEMLEHGGVYSVLGRVGAGCPTILFLAHFDTVPIGEGWNTNPFDLVVEGDRAYGRGTCDDKGNIVSLLITAESVCRKTPGCRILFAVTGDEEVGGSSGAGYLAAHLKETGSSPDYVVVADGIGQQIIFRRRNAMSVRISVKSSIRTITGVNETIRIHTETFGNESRHSAYMQRGVDRHSMLAASKYLDLNPHTVVRDIRGSFVKSNVVPDWVELDVVHEDSGGTECQYDAGLTGLMRSLLPVSHVNFPTQHSDRGTTISPNVMRYENGLWDLYFDVRAMTDDGEPLREAVARALELYVVPESLTVSAGAGCVCSDPNSPLIRAARQAAEAEGIRYSLVEGYGASDSRYFHRHAQVFDFGPVGGNIHGPNEWVSLRSVEENGRMFQRLIEGLLH